ncbi:unnamed protein product [Albugo candida]|uniref:Uncharacterized protein n=1 Tax=Albugo candida TaxID=65357 RepID=A0A024GGL5_9STRA|nr:unnamed protein product [Albugo candida]|eukprot:CCI45840.1 unnamed protein product [Albugo candida]
MRLLQFDNKYLIPFVTNLCESADGTKGNAVQKHGRIEYILSRMRFTMQSAFVIAICFSFASLTHVNIPLANRSFLKDLRCDRPILSQVLNTTAYNR